MVKQIRRRAAGRTVARMMVRVGILPSIPGGGGKEGYMDSEGVGLLRQVTLVVVGGREGWREKLGCCNVTEMHDVYRSGKFSRSNNFSFADRSQSAKILTAKF